jgi:hypothetical protein
MSTYDRCCLSAEWYISRSELGFPARVSRPEETLNLSGFEEGCRSVSIALRLELECHPGSGLGDLSVMRLPCSFRPWRALWPSQLDPPPDKYSAKSIFTSSKLFSG